VGHVHAGRYCCESGDDRSGVRFAGDVERLACQGTRTCGRQAQGAQRDAQTSARRQPCRGDT
jgi:hypothetical protein